MIYESAIHYTEAHQSPTLLRKCILVTGCFDLLHRGHVAHFRFLCDAWPTVRIIVGINSDESVRKLKGIDRPYICQEDRAYVLNELKTVDDVFIFHETDVVHVLNVIRPRYWAKGSDRTMETLDQNEVKAAKSIGTDILFIPRIGDYSTTSLHKKLQAQHNT